MLYGVRSLFFNTRRLIWLPFYVLGHQNMIGLGLLAIGWHWYSEDLHPFEAFVLVLPLLLVVGVSMKMAELLHPGYAPARPAKKVKPLPPAIAGPADTRTSGSPSEPEVLVRLPIALQRFLAEERAPKQTPAG